MSKDVISDIQNLKYLTWSKMRKSSGTAGSFMKAYEENGKRKTYYKLSCYDPLRGIIGHECVNEIIADRLLTILGIPHLRYQLIHAVITLDGKEETVWICASEDYKKPGESKLAFDFYYEMEKEDKETPLAFCIRNGWEDYIYRMLIVDYLILNRDRHGANLEVLKARNSRDVRLAPLFDHGLSLLFSCRTEEEIRKADPMEEKPVQCFVGGRDAAQNLLLIPPDKKPDLKQLRKQDCYYLTEDLENAVSEELLEKIRGMIWGRWKKLEDMGYC